MKRKTTILALAIILPVIVILIRKEENQNLVYEKETKLSEAAKAAFITLDAKVVKCVPTNYLLSGVDTTKQIAPLFDNMGNHHYAITTSDKKAQQFFDQGLKLCYAFNHAEAHRSFMEAARLDPNAAMAYWGQAYALGPNINDPMPDNERKQIAFEAVQKAVKLSAKASKKEQALIKALSARYSGDPEKDIAELNKAFMAAMKDVARQYPEDPEVLTIYADAVMNTMPWNYWDKEGNPHENISEAKAALEKAFSLNPDHAGAHHLYIHMVELPNPDLAVPSAEKLGKLMPSAGHLVHMPSHIFIRVGRYEDAVKANIDAVEADEDYISQCYAQGIYPLAYYPHNIHFLWSASSLLGDSKTALAAAKKTAEKVPVGEMTTLTFLQDYASTPLQAYVRFGKWNDILTTPHPGKDLKHITLIWHYARGIAFVRKNNLKEASEELSAIDEMIKSGELEDLIANYTNPSSKIAKVAYEVVAGEIAAAKGNMEEAIAHFEKGIEYEDDLTYSEPAAWHIPVRQTLGAALLKTGKAAQAEAIYREDLKNLRQNGWSLTGLYQSLMEQGKIDEAEKIKKEFDAAWASADVKIDKSVM